MHIANEYYLIIDFEATCSDDGTVPRHEMEIIEIGAVMMNARVLEIESEFQSFVCPVRHPRLTEFCTSLTSITQGDLADAPSFPAALQAMNEWRHGFGDALFCSWGDYDRNQLTRDCEYHGLDDPFPSGHLNLKAEFARIFGRGKGPGICEALKHVGLDFEGAHHRGLDDALNIARLVRQVCLGA